MHGLIGHQRVWRVESGAWAGLSAVSVQGIIATLHNRASVREDLTIMEHGEGPPAAGRHVWDEMFLKDLLEKS